MKNKRKKGITMTESNLAIFVLLNLGVLIISITGYSFWKYVFEGIRSCSELTMCLDAFFPILFIAILLISFLFLMKVQK